MLTIASVAAVVGLVAVARWIARDMARTYSRARRARIRTLSGV